MKKNLFLITLFLVVFLSCGVKTNNPIKKIGVQSDQSHLLPTSQLIRPAGENVEFGGRPVDLVFDPDGKKIYAKDNRGLIVIDVDSWAIDQELPFKSGGGSMHGMAISADSSRIFATTAYAQLAIARKAENGKFIWETAIHLPGPNGIGNSHPTGIAVTDRKIIYVCLSRNNSIGVIDLGEEKLINEIAVGVAPFDIVLDRDGRFAFVSNWGGRRPKPTDLTAKSSGTDVVVDDRGVGASGSVSIIDLEKGLEIAQIETGLHPSDLVLSNDSKYLFVANANSDSVSVIDLNDQKVDREIVVRPDRDLPFGSMTNALALANDDQTLFAANAGNNAIAVIDLKTNQINGFIPVGWYPGAIATDGESLFITNVKGIGSRSKNRENIGWNVHWHRGSITKVKIPNAEQLNDYTDQVIADSQIPQILNNLDWRSSGEKLVPVPTKKGERSVFDHVVYVIKENRTYDQLFGDLPQGEGDPNLCVFGREITPNHHALAEQFVLLDNYYCNGVNSADGHAWSTEGNVTNYLEKSFGGFTRSYTWGNDPLSYSSSGFIWDNVLMHGLSFRNYGEMDYAQPIPPNAPFSEIYKNYTQNVKMNFTQNIGLDRLRQFSYPNYPGWNMRIPDVLRADRFIEDLRKFEKIGNFPNFTIVYLPNDHTTGTSPGAPTPRAQVADNDLALGRVVEAITHSKFWEKTCIFVIEDDPQAGFDHIDGHRSICLVISPYTKRGEVISDFYNQTGVLHTMERILGLPPMNQMDAMSPLMDKCFTDRSDLTPFSALPNRVPLDEMNPTADQLRDQQLYWAEKSLSEPFDKFDMADEDTLNRIIWHAIKGVDTPYPKEFAGAHGSGFRSRRLIHVDFDDDE